MLGNIDTFGYSATGRDHATNLDQFLIADLNKSLQVHLTTLSINSQSRMFGASQGKLFLVTDGGVVANRAERASQLAVDTVSTYLLNTMPWMLRLDATREDDFVDDLKAAIDACQETIKREAGVIEANAGMGTALTLAYVLWPRLYVVHVGHTRCYIMRQGGLKQLTRDHTQAEKLVDEGMIAAEDAEDHPWSQAVWNVVGGKSDGLEPDVHRVELQQGDKLILCTDGLHRHVAETEISRVTDEAEDAENAAKRLVETARTNGSVDSITAVVARLGSGEGYARSDVSSAEVPAAEETTRTPPTPQPESISTMPKEKAIFAATGNV